MLAKMLDEFIEGLVILLPYVEESMDVFSIGVIGSQSLQEHMAKRDPRGNAMNHLKASP